MPLPTWPSQLPCPLRANYAWTPGAQHERTAFGGPVEDANRIFSASRVLVPLNVYLTSNGASLLEAWVSINDPFQNWVLIPVDIGQGIQQYESRFLRYDVPRQLAGKREWIVPFEIEIRARADGSYWAYTAGDDGEAAWILAFGGAEEMERFSDRLDQIVNIEMPEWLEPA